METNFFQNLSTLQVTGDWNIVISKGNDAQLIVSVLLIDKTCGDAAKKVIPPAILKGTAEELDNGFFNSLAAPIQVTAQLFANMDNYMKQQEQAQLQSKMEKDKTVKTEKVKTEKESKYDAAIKKVAELEAAGKYSEAWMKVPDPSEYPENADYLRSRKEELSAHFAPDLFNS